ncbi:MAG: macro domain-containing protein [Chloroflexota bacterium]|nr:macro domain-containing protein [Chloroflexota bacterium]MDE2840743.1 macro domain-containing protein [Chloroflexota bacterium]MDE2931779.1 macro domain-containing protein [Chloroflexota bacterium]
MIRYKTGDILAEDVEALVNSVNCVGVMGRGIALQFKQAFPENFKAYAAACKRDEVKPGHMFVFETGHLAGPRYIINFPTKRHWRGKSRMEDIESGLAALAQEIKERNIRSIALPPLGSGLGGLEWQTVRQRIEAGLRELTDVTVVVFKPGGAPVDGSSNRSRDVPQMTPGRAVLVGLMDRYRRGLLVPFVTLLEVHKLLYFMQEAGEQLKLRYQKAPLGPYAENLRHVLKDVEGHLITGYADGGDAPNKELELVPGTIDDARAFLKDHPETRARFDKVSKLVDGFESPFGLELLTTVHWVACEHPGAKEEEIIAQTYAWNERKRQFSERQIGLALRVLEEQGWLRASHSPSQAAPKGS